MIAEGVPSPYGTPTNLDPYQGRKYVAIDRESWSQNTEDMLQTPGAGSRVGRLFLPDASPFYTFGAFNMERRKKHDVNPVYVLLWEILGGKIQITNQGDRDFAERYFTQGFLDTRCQLVGPRLQEGWRQFADDVVPKKYNVNMLVAKEIEKELDSEGKRLLDWCLDKRNLGEYKMLTPGLTFDAVYHMSIDDIMALLSMPREHATLLYQEVQKYDADTLRWTAPRPPQSTPDRQTHVAKGTVTPQPEDVMELRPSTKDKETVIWNKRTSDGKRTPLCVVRHHNIRHRWPQQMSADDRKERHQYFKDRCDKAMLAVLERRAASDERKARKRKRAEDKGGSGAGSASGGGASGGAPKKKRG
jgi:hypothetical protein